MNVRNKNQDDKDAQQSNKKGPPHFTGWVSGDASVLSYSFIIGALFAGTALKPAVRAYDYIKKKLERPDPPLFVEEELNDWYHYYKEYGKYPEYLEKKYSDKYPNLRDIFLGNAEPADHNVPRAVAKQPEVNLMIQTNNHFYAEASEKNNNDFKEEMDPIVILKINNKKINYVIKRPF